MSKGLGADSEEKREPGGDINTALVDSLKALDPNRPIREVGHIVYRAAARQSNEATRFFVRDSVVASGDHHGGCVIFADMGEADQKSDRAELTGELLQRRLDRIVGNS